MTKTDDGKRKVVQIAVCRTSNDYYTPDRLYALCDDGVIFTPIQSVGSDSDWNWRRIPDVPQGMNKT